MSQHESTDNKANICILGAGATGLQIVSCIAAHLHDVISIGLEIGTAVVTPTDSLQRINIINGGKYQADNLASLMKFIETAEFVFLVAGLDETPVDLRQLRMTVKQRSVRMFLVTPEPVEESERRATVSILRDGKRFVYEVPTPVSASSAVNQLDGIIVISGEALPQHAGHLLVPDHPNIARWVTNTAEDMRSIPAFERKKWFLHANESK